MSESRPVETVRPGDIVIPSSGPYRGVQCEVKGAGPPDAGTYHFLVVPVFPLADKWLVGAGSRVSVVPRIRPTGL